MLIAILEPRPSLLQSTRASIFSRTSQIQNPRKSLYFSKQFKDGFCLFLGFLRSLLWDKSTRFGEQGFIVEGTQATVVIGIYTIAQTEIYCPFIITKFVRKTPCRSTCCSLTTLYPLFSKKGFAVIEA